MNKRIKCAILCVLAAWAFGLAGWYDGPVKEVTSKVENQIWFNTAFQNGWDLKEKTHSPDLMGKAYAMLLSALQLGLTTKFYEVQYDAKYLRISTKTIRNRLDDDGTQSTGYIIDLYICKPGPDYVPNDGFLTFLSDTTIAKKSYYFSTTSDGTNRFIYTVNRDLVGKTMFDRLFALHLAALTKGSIVWNGYSIPSGQTIRNVTMSSIYGYLSTTTPPNPDDGINYISNLFPVNNTEIWVTLSRDWPSFNWSFIRESNATGMVRPLNADRMFTQLLDATTNNKKVWFWNTAPTDREITRVRIYNP